ARVTAVERGNLRAGGNLPQLDSPCRSAGGQRAAVVAERNGVGRSIARQLPQLGAGLDVPHRHLVGGAGCEQPSVRTEREAIVVGGRRKLTDRASGRQVVQIDVV